jgi:uncharacterized membrane protein YhhN
VSLDGDTEARTTRGRVPWWVWAAAAALLAAAAAVLALGRGGTAVLVGAALAFAALAAVLLSLPDRDPQDEGRC